MSRIGRNNDDPQEQRTTRSAQLWYHGEIIEVTESWPQLMDVPQQRRASKLITLVFASGVVIKYSQYSPK